MTATEKEKNKHKPGFSIVPYLQLIRLSKPIGVWVFVCPGLWTILLALRDQQIPLQKGIQIVFFWLQYSFIARGAACTINDIFDLDIDSKTPRTMSRPLPSGRVTVTNATIYFVLQMAALMAFIRNLSFECQQMMLLRMFILSVYPLGKRYTYWPQLILGIGIGLDAPIASLMITGQYNWPVSGLVYIADICWIIFFDTVYAQQDVASDIKNGVKSTAVLFAQHTKKILSIFLIILTLSLAGAGYLNGQSWIFFAVSVVGSFIHLFWQMIDLALDNQSSIISNVLSNFTYGVIVAGGAAADYALSVS